MIKNLTLKQKIIGIVAIFSAICIIATSIYLCTNEENDDISSLILDDSINNGNSDIEGQKDNSGLSNNIFEDTSETSDNGQNPNGENQDDRIQDSENQYAENQNGENQNDENQYGKIQDTEEKIVIHIMGEVKNPGVITLNSGARIVDAIEKAGGATQEADIDAVNLAYVLQDGQKINIPNKKDREKNQAQEYITSESGNNVIIKGNETSEGKGVKKKVNINEASQSDLETLPGIGESIASRIIEYREQNGKFTKTEDLQNVKGIGDSKYNKIKDLITVK